MELGHVDSIEGIDLSLPADDPITTSVLSAVAGSARVRVGLPIWNKKEWVGGIYPPGAQPSLPAYGKLYDTVEVNSTFYHPPGADVIAGWAESVPDDFRFLPKVWRAISHVPDASAEDITRFIESVTAFGDRLGPCFLQLPPQADFTWKRPLARLLDVLGREVKLALELRHPAWFRDRETRRRLFDHLAEKRIGLVITDTAGRRDLVHMGVSADFTLVRFKGQGLGALDIARIDAWAARLAEWSGRGLGEAFFIAHERTDFEREGAPLATRLGTELRARGISLARSLVLPVNPQLGLL